MRAIAELLGSPLKIKLMDCLLTREKYVYSVSELARLNNMPKSTVSGIVNQWQKTLFIKVQQFGKTKTVQVNSEFKILPLLKELFQAPIQPYVKIAKGIQGLSSVRNNSAVLALILYGSVAQKNVSASSDIDLLMVTPNHQTIKIKNQIEKLLNDIDFLYNQYSIPIQVIELSKSKFCARIQEGDHFIQNVLNNGKILKGREFVEHCKRTL